MIFLFVLMFAFVVIDAKPGYSGSASTENDLGSTGGSGSAGNSYGYSGSFSGTGADLPGNVPFASFIPQFDFTPFFEQLTKQHQQFIEHGGGYFSYSYASSGPGGSAQAQSSITYDNRPNYGIQKLAVQGVASSGGETRTGIYQGSHDGNGQSAASGSSAGGYGGGVSLGNRGGFVGGYGGGFSGPDGNSFSFSGPIGGSGTGAAFASGSIGPDGGQQTAGVYPENPNSPNINTRFGADGSSGGDGFKSVFTSSKSVSSNVDGKPTTYRQAQTTINDNGKVTTYTAHDP